MFAINTNMAAIYSQGDLAINSKALSGTLERLSTGLRLNKAADDAAGLGVSEKLDSSVRALRQSYRNANDAISMIQVAEGGTKEIENMIKRLKELMVQASSETLGQTERDFISNEAYELRLEVDRISQVTEWNGINLLNVNGAGGGTTTMTNGQSWTIPAGAKGLVDVDEWNGTGNSTFPVGSAQVWGEIFDIPGSATTVDVDFSVANQVRTRTNGGAWSAALTINPPGAGVSDGGDSW